MLSTDFDFFLLDTRINLSKEFEQLEWTAIDLHI